MSQNWTREPTFETEYGRRYVSATQIKSYRTCPEQYRFKYETDLEPTKLDKGYLELGSAVHEAIEVVLLEEVGLDEDGNPIEQDEQRDDGGMSAQLPTLDEDTLTRKFKRAYQEYDPDLDDEMYGNGLDYLEVAARYLDAKQPTIRGVEQKGGFGLARKDIEEQFFGVIDVTTDEGLIDWKTGTIRDDTAVEEQIQGAIYMKIYQHLYDEPPNSIQFVYLKEGKLRSLDPDDATWGAMLNHARTLKRGKEAGDFTGKPGDMCYFCGFEGYCEYADAGVGNVNWETY